jgi:hypothetical protein
LVVDKTPNGSRDVDVPALDHARASRRAQGFGVVRNPSFQHVNPRVGTSGMHTAISPGYVALKKPNGGCWR